MAHLGTAETKATLELGVDHAPAAGDVLLIVRDVVVHSAPAAHLNLGVVALAELGGRGPELVASHAADGADLRRREKGEWKRSGAASLLRHNFCFR